MQNEITIALPKGRIADESLNLFRHILKKDIVFNDRKLILDVDNFRFLLIRNQDVPTYVYHGVADLGVVGLDVIEEKELDIVRVLDLQIGKCKVVLGSEIGKSINYLKPRIKIATKMENIAKKYFSRNAIAVEIIKLYGSIELAPLVNLSDGIVDIYESGNTMRQNNLQVDEVIMESSAFLIANELSFFTKKIEILNLREELKKIVQEECK